MKTIIYKQNKPATQLRNRLLQIGALAVSLGLCWFILTAQDNWPELLAYSSMGEMARILVSETEMTDTELVGSTSGMNHSELTEKVDKALTIENRTSSDLWFPDCFVPEKKRNFRVFLDEQFWPGKAS